MGHVAAYAERWYRNKSSLYMHLKIFLCVEKSITPFSKIIDKMQPSYIILICLFKWYLAHYMKKIFEVITDQKYRICYIFFFIFQQLQSQISQNDNNLFIGFCKQILLFISVMQCRRSIRFLKYSLIIKLSAHWPFSRLASTISR